MTKKEIEALKEVQKVYREADKLIQSILERQTAEQRETQTNQECEQLILNSRKSIQSVNSTLENEDIENIISRLLHELGVPSHIKGYKYLITAIRLAMEDQDNIEFVTKKLYPNVAKKHKTTSMRVERAIRRAIEVTYKNYLCSEVSYKIFGNSISREKGKPINSHFIAAISEYLLRNYNFA